MFNTELGYFLHRPPDGMPYYEAILESPGTAIAYLIVLFAISYQLVQHYGLHALQSIPEVLWSLIVMLVPSRFVEMLESQKDSDELSSQQWTSGQKYQQIRNASMDHAAKSKALQRILGWKSSKFSVSEGKELDNGLSSSFQDIQKQPHKPAGLGNWDHSCYQNSVVQGLSSLRPMRSFLSDFDPSLVPQSGVIGALTDIVGKLNDQNSSGQRYWNPAELKSMSSWQPQDAQEYFSKVLDEVEKESTKILRAKQINKGFHGFDEATETLHSSLPSTRGLNASSSFDRYSSESAPALDNFCNPLEGLLAQRVSCTSCGWSEGLSLIPFICLTVPLSQAMSSDIRACLGEFTQLEFIEGVNCAKCTLLRTKTSLERILAGKSRTDPSAQTGNDSSTSPNPIHLVAQSRLDAINGALENDEFSDETLNEKCKIPQRSRVSTTKTRQAVLARCPRSLVIHVNRSVFDEYTGTQGKNYCNVNFPARLDVSAWCIDPEETQALGLPTDDERLEPSRSMLKATRDMANSRYQLRSVVAHYGRHENGHYVCFKREPYGAAGDDLSLHGGLENRVDDPGKDTTHQRWWRLSDDDVSEASESEVLNQGQVFMLFYDRIDEALPESSLSSPLDQCTSENEATSGWGENIEDRGLEPHSHPEPTDDGPNSDSEEGIEGVSPFPTQSRLDPTQGPPKSPTPSTSRSARHNVNAEPRDCGSNLESSDLQRPLANVSHDIQKASAFPTMRTATPSMAGSHAASAFSEVA